MVIEPFCQTPLAYNRSFTIRRGRNYRSSQQQTSEYRVNRQIRAREVRLIDHDGDNRGVVDINTARDIAAEAELDLVEVAPNANPPVCRVMDYGKFIYEKAKREKEARKHQKQIEIKTIKLTPRTSDYHKDIYIRKARNWLEDGKKVKFQVRFKAREITYPEIGQETLEDIAEALAGDAAVEQHPKLEGWSMTMMLTPDSS